MEQPVNNSQSKLYDLSLLEEIGKGNREFIAKMLKLFVEQTPASVNEIRQSFEVNDLARVKALAHRIKPSIDNMGIASLKNEIRKIELLAENGNNNDELKLLIHQLYVTISSVVRQLEQYELR